MRHSTVKLDDCIKLFMNAEILDGEDKPVRFKKIVFNSL